MTSPAALLLWSALAAAAPVKGASCKGTLSGAVRGSFPCTVSAFSRDGGHYLVIEPGGPIEKVPGYWPGSFQLSSAPRARTYRLDDLVAGRASVAAEGGALYSATKTSSQRGEVTIRLTAVAPGPQGEGSYLVRGSYQARLLPVGAGKSGEVAVDVKF